MRQTVLRFVSNHQKLGEEGIAEVLCLEGNNFGNNFDFVPPATRAVRKLVFQFKPLSQLYFAGQS